MLLVPPAVASEPHPCELIQTPPQSVQAISDRWTLVDAIRQCANPFSNAHELKTDVAAIRQQLEEEYEQIQSVTSELVPAQSALDALEAQEFSTTTQLTGLTVLGVQHGDSIGDRPIHSATHGQTAQIIAPQ